MRLVAGISIMLLSANTVSFTQQDSAGGAGASAPRTEAQQVNKTRQMSADARLTSAKSVYVRKGRGSEIPYNVISSGLEGWGRYTFVDSPEKAELIIEITAPEDSSGISVSSSTTRDAYGKEENSTKTSKDLSSSAMITMTVYDARNKVPLWRTSEQSKSAMKQKARQDNMVAAAQRVLAKFRERVEPER